MNNSKKIKKWRLTKFLVNKSFKFKRNDVLNYIPSNMIGNAYNTISNWISYKATPLLELDKLQKDL